MKYMSKVVRFILNNDFNALREYLKTNNDNNVILFIYLLMYNECVIHSFDGKVWRLYVGKKEKVSWEGNQNDISWADEERGDFFTQNESMWHCGECDEEQNIDERWMAEEYNEV